MVGHIVQTYIHKSKCDYRLFCSSLYGCVLRSNINQYNLSPNGIEHNREPHRLKKNNKMHLEFFYSGIDNSTPFWGNNNRKHIIRVAFSLLHKDRKTKMLHKASKQAIYNSIYEEGIYNPLIIKNNNNINIMKENDNMNRQFDEVMAREIYNLLDEDFNIIDTTVEIINDEDFGNVYQVTIGVEDGDYNYDWFESIYPTDLGTITFPLDILVDDLCMFLNDNDIDY